MGITKTDSFSSAQNEIALQLKALGHPARIAIIEHLLKVKSCICGDIVNEISLSQPTISQHLKELKTAGLIKGTIDGKTICYCLNEQAFTNIRQYLTNITSTLELKNNCCN